MARRHGGLSTWLARLTYLQGIYKDEIYYPRDLFWFYTAPEAICDYVIASDAEGLDDAARQLPTFLSGDHQVAFMRALLKVHHHALVTTMLTLYDRPLVGRYARAWLMQEGANAIHGLVGFLKTSHKTRALELLRTYRAGEHGAALLEAGLVGVPDESCQMVRRYVLEHSTASIEEVAPEDRPEWLVALAQDKKLARKRVPDFIGVCPLVLTWRGEKLGGEDVELLCKVLKESSLEEPHPALVSFREWLDPESAATFAWFLYKAWMRDKARSTHKWALWALAFLGDEHSPGKLGGEMKRWPSVCAKWGVAVLVWLGSNEAIRVLCSFAQQRKHNAIWRYSLNGLRAIARQREVLVDVLEDSSVPDFGFDERGERLFDYGERKFWLRLDEQLAPRFFDQQKGRYIKSLPRILKADDLEIAERSRAQYEIDKYRLRTVIKSERARFEQMFKDRRVWSRVDWERAMCHHPLLNHFATRVLWWGELEQEDGQPRRRAFRLLPDRTLSDVHDELVELDPQARISLLHPVQIDVGELMGWANLLTDYEIIQPFEQLTRSVYTLGEGDRFVLPEGVMSSRRVSLAFKKVSWAISYDHQQELCAFKSCEAFGVTFMACFKPSEVQLQEFAVAWWELECVSWTPGEYAMVDAQGDERLTNQGASVRSAPRVALSTVDAALLSETLREVYEIWAPE